MDCEKNGLSRLSDDFLEFTENELSRLPDDFLEGAENELSGLPDEFREWVDTELPEDDLNITSFNVWSFEDYLTHILKPLCSYITVFSSSRIFNWNVTNIKSRWHRFNDVNLHS